MATAGRFSTVRKPENSQEQPSRIFHIAHHQACLSPPESPDAPVPITPQVEAGGEEEGAGGEVHGGSGAGCRSCKDTALSLTDQGA